MSRGDYYEILGVRPNAAREEIELAFRGRRSQYHPDRYAQSDSETQDWATCKMKEVNEAYRVLASAELRADFDRSRLSSKPTGSQSQPHPEPMSPAQEAKDAASILLDPKWEWFHDRVYAQPNIPRKKLEGAIASYAPKVVPSAVIVLLDDTLFGGAKEGMLVTNDALYCKQKFEPAKRIAFSTVTKVEPGTNSRVIVNGREFFKAELIDHLAVLTFSARLSSVFKQADPATDRTPPSPHDRLSGIDAFLAVHRDALYAIRVRGADGLLVDDLIARQIGSIADSFSELRQAAMHRSKSRTESIDAECAEAAIMLFLVLHYYGYSKLPRDFWKAGRDLFERVKEICDGYIDEFVDRFPRVFRRPFDTEIIAISNAFLGCDDADELMSRISQEGPILRMLSNIGISEPTAQHLLRESLMHAATWLEEFFAVLEGER